MQPEKGGAFLDVRDHRLRELVAEQRGSRVEIQREHDGESEDGDGEEEHEAPAFDEEELSGVGAAVAGDLAAGGGPDGEELGEESGGAGHAAVVAAELEEEEDGDAA